MLQTKLTDCELRMQNYAAAHERSDHDKHANARLP